MIAFAQLQLREDFSNWHEPRVAAPDAFSWDLEFPFPQKRLRSGYALGWRVFQLTDDSTHETRLVFHAGYLNGVSAVVAVMKKHDLAIIALANDDQFIPHKIAFDIWSKIANNFGVVKK